LPTIGFFVLLELGFDDLALLPVCVVAAAESTAKERRFLDEQA